MRRFHAPSAGVLTATDSLRAELAAHGIGNLRHWSRGVDLDHFSPAAAPPPQFAGLPRPIQLYVGRVAVEKNIEAFLETRHPGTKVVIGDGPARASLAAAYPGALFVGPLEGAALAGAYAGADVFVFPSRTDTFGLVMIEALASDTPVAAFPVHGPLDILSDEVAAMDDDLGAAIALALTRNRAVCSAFAARFSWAKSARQFLAALVPCDEARPIAA